MSTVPEPGIYPDMPMGSYLAWDALSNSGVGRLLRSPAHYQAYAAAPTPDTPDMRLGRAVHAAILQPSVFAGTYAGEPDINGPEFANHAKPRASKMYKEMRAEMESLGAEVLTCDEWDAVVGMKEAVHAHPRAAKLIQSTGRAELSMVWDDEATGVRCKSRIDWHTPSKAGGAIVDLKTTTDASPGAFERTIFRFGYHRQGTLYLRGARAAGLAAAHFVLIAVEKTPPYGVVLYRLDDDAVRLGETQVDFGLARYAHCRAKDEWPGYTTDVVDIGVPKWADAAVERDLEEVALT